MKSLSTIYQQIYQLYIIILIIFILHISSLGIYIDVTLKLPMILRTHINLKIIKYAYIFILVLL